MEQYMGMKVQMAIQSQLIFGCFTDCVSSYRDATLAVGEQKCVQNCAARHMQAVESMQEVQG